ncbi:MAG: hypothetical protein ABI461_23510, partial [Polyangiaceae bacterium]
TLADERARDRSEPALLRMRIAVWRGKDDLVKDARQRAGRAIRDAKGSNGVLLRLFHAEDHKTSVEPAQALAMTAGIAPRARAHIHSLLAERLALAGDIRGATASVKAARDAGLLDLLWLEKCTALDGLRLRADFTSLVSDVRSAIEAK